MASLVRIRNVEWALFNGYLAACQLMFVRGELNLTLESAFYEITNSVTDEEVVLATYSTTNEIETRQEIVLEHMKQRVNETLRFTRAYWAPRYEALASLMEKNLQDGFWDYLQPCIDVTTCRIVELGNNVPYVNMDHGFTFLLYSKDNSRCLMLIANWSD